jgi:hypothetical protein
MGNIEIYQSDLGEKAVKIFIKRCWELELEKITKKKDQKTPDFEIKDSNENIIAIGEVKSCVDSSTAQSFKSMLNISQDDLYEISKKADKNHRSKLEKHNNKAISQLVNYSNFISIIFFVSFDMTDYIDMDIMLQEQKKLYPFSPIADIYVLFKVHQSIIPSEIFEIKETPQFRYDNKKGKDFLDKYLSLQQALKNNAILPLTLKI